MSIHPPVPEGGSEGTSELLAQTGLRPDEENPWIGLFSFTEDIRAFFHGREGESEALARMVTRRTLTVLYGESGLGKSSLLQAGLFPLLRADRFLPVYIRLNCAVQASAAAEAKATIGREIARAIASGEVVSPRLPPEVLAPREDETFWDYLHRLHEGDLCLPISETRAAERAVELVLAFDQFEEIFTLGQLGRRGQRRGPIFTLLQDLADCIENRLPAHVKQRFDAPGETANGDAPADADGHRRQNYRFILSLRKDFVAELDDLRDIMPSVMENRMLLRPLDGRQALDAVILPGRKLVTPYVARRIVRFVSAMKRSGSAAGPCGSDDEDTSEELQLSELQVDPSLLSMVCRELNKKRRQLPDQSMITKDLVEQSSRTILDDFYEECFRDEPEAVRRFVEDCLLNENDRRRQMDLPDAEAQLAREGVQTPNAAVERLVQHRLIRMIEGPDQRSAQLELAHDVLCQVVSAKRLEREARLAQERDAAERLAAAHEREAQLLAETERQAREAIEAAERYRRLRKERRRGIAFTAGLFVVALGMGYSLYKAHEAKEQLDRFKRTASEQNYDRAKLYADRAAQRGRQLADAPLDAPNTSLEPRGNVLALTHLARALRDNPKNRAATALACRLLLGKTWCLPLATLPKKDDNDKLLALTPTPDGRIAAVSQDGSLLCWKVDGKNSPKRDVRELQAGGVQSAAFSRDGRRLLTGTKGRQEARLWRWDDNVRSYVSDPSGGLEQLANNDFRAVAWSPDGQWMVIVPTGGSGRFRLFRKETGAAAYTEITALLQQPNERVNTADISIDGQRIVSGSFDGKVRLWRTDHLEDPPKEFVPVRAMGRTTINDRVFYTIFSPDPEGRYVAAVYGDGPVRIWDTGSSEQPLRLPIGFALDGCTRLTYSRDGRRILETTIRGTAQIWDLETQRPLCEPLCHESMVYYGAFSTDGNQVISGEGNTFGRIDTVEVWDATLLPPAPEADVARFDNVDADAPGWLAKLSEAVSGIKLDATGYEYGPPTSGQVAREIPAPAGNGTFGPVLRRFQLALGGGNPAKH